MMGRGFQNMPPDQRRAIASRDGRGALSQMHEQGLLAVRKRGGFPVMGTDFGAVGVQTPISENATAPRACSMERADVGAIGDGSETIKPYRYVPQSNRIPNLRNPWLSVAARAHKWECAVASLNGQIRAFIVRNKPTTVTRLRDRLNELIAERCIVCGKFWHVANEKHATSCIHSERRG